MNLDRIYGFDYYLNPWNEQFSDFIIYLYLNIEKEIHTILIMR